MKVEVPTLGKVKIPVGVEVRISSPTTEVKGLLLPRSRSCKCLHY